MERETFYHGTSLLGIKGKKIRANVEIVNNNVSLGLGFYTTTHLEAAKMFSHLAEKRRWLKMRIDNDKALEGAENAGLGKVYSIDLSGINLLKWNSRIDRQTCIDMLNAIGMDRELVGAITLSNTTSVDRVCLQIEKAGILKENAYQYLTKVLGYDGLLVREKEWNSWDYYPSDIGIDYKKFKECPDTAVIYNTQKIKSFIEVDLSTEAKLAALKKTQPEISLRHNQGRKL